ncbi:flagellar assembly protein FliW [Paenibacillus aurantius]|uniref:Flagellar assembly factor FliW n=1 Tax=Paenibacillus aurantius TaxID=2918900 RepID=A0AA96LD79_9BACL|nr:flagellar assembly protein FliW [Paenibacillus aurantius]WNQ11602.1 flagellar assembly protein FliW [Paenibacillus aurantius]
MLVTTRWFGDIEVQEDEIFTFPQGLPGFPDHQRFMIIRNEGEIPVSYLQSVDEGELAFILADPFYFFPGYQVELTEGMKEELGMPEPEDLVIMVMLSVPDSLEDATANLLAPLAIHTKTRTGKQLVLHQSEYKTKHKLIPENQGG